MILAVVSITIGHAILCNLAPPDVSGGQLALYWLALGVGCLALFWTGVRGARAVHFMDDTASYRFGWILILASLVLRFLWVSAFDTPQFSDFRDYWDWGRWLASGHPPASLGVHFERAFLYTYPIQLVWGDSLLGLEVTNVGIATVTAGLFLCLGCRLYGRRIAALSLLFFLTWPDYWYSMTVASHDIPTLFWLALLYLGFDSLYRRLAQPEVQVARSVIFWICTLGLAVSLGAVIFALEIQRNYGTFIVLSLALCPILLFVWKHPPRQLGRYVILTLFLVVVPTTVYKVLDAGFHSVYPVRLTLGPVELATMMNVLDWGDLENDARWFEQYALIPEEIRLSFGCRKLVQEFVAEPLELGRYLASKNAELAKGHTYLVSFFDQGAYGSQGSRPSGASYKVQKLVVRAITIVVLLLALVRLTLYRLLPFRRESVFVYLLSGCIYGFLVALLWALGRYDIFLIFPFSWMAAEALIGCREFSTRQMAQAARAASLGLLRGAGVLLVLVLIYCGLAGLIKGTRLTLTDQAGFLPATALPESLGARLRLMAEEPVVSNFKSVVLRYPRVIDFAPGSAVGVEKDFTVPGPTAQVRFFLQGSGATEEGIVATVLGNGRVLVSESLDNLKHPVFYSFEVPGVGGSFRLQLWLSNRRYLRTGSVPSVSLEFLDLR